MKERGRMKRGGRKRGMQEGREGEIELFQEVQKYIPIYIYYQIE